MKKAMLLVAILFAVIPVPAAAISGFLSSISGILISIFNSLLGLFIDRYAGICSRVDELMDGYLLMTNCEGLQGGCRFEVVPDGFFRFKLQASGRTTTCNFFGGEIDWSYESQTVTYLAPLVLGPRVYDPVTETGTLVSTDAVFTREVNLFGDLIDTVNPFN